MQVRGLTQYDRVAFACRFLDDEELTSYLDHLEESALKSGALQGLLLSGLTERSLPLLQAFVDRTADVQTGALLSTLVSPRRFKSEIAEQWMTTYRCAAPATPCWRVQLYLQTPDRTGRLLLVLRANEVS